MTTTATRTGRPAVRTPLARSLFRLAALIADEDLPGARVTAYGPSLTVGPLLEDDDETSEHIVRRWAQALGLVVHERPHTADDGTAERFLLATGSAAGFEFVSVAAILAITEAAA